MAQLWERVGLLASIALLLGGCGGAEAPSALPSDSQGVVEVSDDGCVMIKFWGTDTHEPDMRLRTEKG